MRTTVDLPDKLFRRAKAVSSLEGLTLKEFITRAIEHELEGGTVDLKPRRITLPIVKSKRPGSVLVTSERLAELLERDDLHSAS